MEIVYRIVNADGVIEYEGKSHREALSCVSPDEVKRLIKRRETSEIKYSGNNWGELLFLSDNEI